MCFHRRLEEPLLTQQHRTVRAQLEYLRLRRSMMMKTEEKPPAKEPQPPMPSPATKLLPVMTLDTTQRKRLQQQMQQHVQLLTQLHLLSFRNPKICTEANTAEMYLAELLTFAERSALTHGAVNPHFHSTFQACNLKEALQLLPLVHSQVPEDVEPPRPMRKNANAPNLPKHTAWVLATRSVFMYPELLPVCAMKPRGPRDRVFFTKAEDNLLALGLKHFEGLESSRQLISKYLMTAKTAKQLTLRIRNLTMKAAPDNIIKVYEKTKTFPPMSRCCEDVLAQDARPPVEVEKHRLPFWIKASLASIEERMKKSPDSRYPLILPPEVSLILKPLPKRFFSKSWRQRRSSLKPLLIRPTAKLSAPQTIPVRIVGQMPPLVQPAVAMQRIVNLQPVNVPARKAPYVSAATTKTQVVLPSMAAQKTRISLVCTLPKKAEAKTLGPQASPILQSAPVVFAVPHGALKLVSLGTTCSVLQPLSPGTTVLLSPAHVPLSQTLEPPPCTQKLESPCPEVYNDQPEASSHKSEEDEWECVSITIKVEDDESFSTVGEGTTLQDKDQPEGTPNPEEPGVSTESPQSVPLHDFAASPPPSKTEDPGEVEEAEEINQEQQTEQPGDSPKNMSSTDGDVAISSPVGAQIDSSSPMDGQDQGNDKDVPEEEEDEDFDDLTQDEDDISSEESVLSVPELQETMEKLTWLASERRLSQEGDSEDNSQEENTEPEEEEEGVDGSSQKPEEMTDEAGDEKLLICHQRVPSPVPVESSMAPAVERRRGGSKGQSSHRARSRRGRARASKDSSKLLLLYDEKILTKDPLREQKDMAFAQSYLNRVRDVLQTSPGTYQQFLNLIYEFETKGEGKTPVHLYEGLRLLLQDWPQLLKDFAAFLLPEQALECGLFEEQQAFDKSRRFLRQLEICFQENPAQHQKIIKLLQSCAECPLQETGKLKTQMWQLLKGHTHLQDEFSLFFDQLRPPPSRMEDFEVMNWTEDKDYTFDGFEEVTIPDMEEEEEQSKVAAPQRSKKRKDGGSGLDKDVDWPDGVKECPCSCHDVGMEQRMKRSKRRVCAQCTSKGCDSRSTHRSTDGASAMKDAADRLSLPGARGPSSSRTTMAVESSGSVQRLRSGTDTGKARNQLKRASARGGRRPQALKPVHQSPSTHDAPSLSSAPTISSELRPSPAPEDPPVLQATAREEQTPPMCAKNIKVRSSGEKVVWTREADRVILTMCQQRGAQDDTFTAISVQLGNKSPSEVSERFRELINLFQTGSVTSSDDEDEDNVSDEEED
ncbi:hypothetical protein GDO81_029457 [Engystomops pustulosus]|uniref:GON-4-like protein n=1 Tax=Engystomops pustulosus TaxID=76066 RepID=A0AAV6YVT1_ENGPU|nr:hypothetical protein GDO81_029457 [Engystomops pustulosus]